MPDVEKPGPDGGSPLNASIQLRLDNSSGDRCTLSYSAVLTDHEKQSHPVDFHVQPDASADAWDGSLAKGEVRTIELVTHQGPYLPAGSNIVVRMDWKDQYGNTVSVTNLESSVERVE
jgi:hypothetical protein